MTSPAPQHEPGAEVAELVDDGRQDRLDRQTTDGLEGTEPSVPAGPATRAHRPITPPGSADFAATSQA